MLSFEVQLEGAFTIEVLEQGFRKWMSAIEIDADRFDVRIIPGFGADRIKMDTYQKRYVIPFD